MMKLKASSLVEILVATVILGLTFGICLATFIRITSMAPSMSHLKATSEIEKLYHDLIAKEITIGESVIPCNEKYSAHVSVKSYSQRDNLFHIVIALKTDEQKIIVERKGLCFQP